MPKFLGQRDQGESVFTSGQMRVYIHVDPKPTKPIYDYGMTEFSGFTFSSPEPEQILIPDRTSFNRWKRVGRVVQPDEFQTTDFTTTANGAGKDNWEDLRKLQLNFTMYITVGATREGVVMQADDPHSWTMKAQLPDALVVSVTPFGETVNSKSENSEAMATGTLQYGNGDIIRTVEFSDVSGSLAKNIVAMQALDNISYNEVFGITDVGANQSDIVHFDSRTNTLTTITGTEWSATGALSDIAIVGNSAMAVCSDGTNDGHYISSLDDIRAGNDNWLAITGGYVASNGPVAIEVVSAGNILAAGLNGYIYNYASPTSEPTVVDAGNATTEDFSAIDSENGWLVAVGANNAVVYSSNGGGTWSGAVGPAVGVALSAVEVVAPNQVYVGTATGLLYFGEFNPVSSTFTWSQVGVVGTAIDGITDIQFSSRINGWVLGTDSVGGTAVLFRTTSAGQLVSSGLPELSRFNSVTTTAGHALAVINANEVYASAASNKLLLGQ